MPVDNKVASAAGIADSMDSFMGKAPSPAQSPPETTPAQSPAQAQTPASAKPPETTSKDLGSEKRESKLSKEMEMDLSGAIDLASGKKPEEKKPDDAPVPEEMDEDDKRFQARDDVKDLRNAYYKTKATLKSLTKEMEALKAKPATAANKEELEALTRDRDALKERVTKIETEKETLAKNLAKLDYTKSPEFDSEYLKPWREAQGEALEELSQFKRENEKGEEVAITWDDLAPVFNLPTPKALEKLKELFPDDTVRQVALLHRNKIISLRGKWVQAAEQAEALSKNAEVDREKALEQTQQIYGSERKRLQAQYGDAYTTSGDEETKIHMESDEIAKLAIWGKQGIKPETRVRAAAITASRAAMMPVFAHRLNAANAKIAKLEADLASARGGGPGGGIQGGGSAVDPTDIGASMDAWKKNH